MEHLDHKARVAADPIEDSACASARGQVPRVGAGSIEDWQLLEVQAELVEPTLGMRHGAIRALPRGRGGNDKPRPGAGAFREQPILLLVAWVELVASDQGEHSSHAPSICRRCPTPPPFSSPFP